MNAKQILQKLNLIEDVIDFKPHTLKKYMPTEDEANLQLAQKALNSLGINVNQDIYNLKKQDLAKLAGYLYNLGYEDGLNDAELE